MIEDNSGSQNPQIKQMELNTNNIGYNCSECSSIIEILSINEDNIIIIILKKLKMKKKIK